MCFQAKNILKNNRYRECIEYYFLKYFYLKIYQNNIFKNIKKEQRQE